MPSGTLCRGHVAPAAPDPAPATTPHPATPHLGIQPCAFMRSSQWAMMSRDSWGSHFCRGDKRTGEGHYRQERSCGLSSVDHEAEVGGRLHHSFHMI